MPSLPPEWGNVQPRYAAYCITLGARSREEMVERDAAAYPGGKMTGFLLWIDAGWRTWDEKRGGKPQASRSAADHAAFTEWLLEGAEQSWIC